MKIIVPRAAMRALMHLALQPVKKSERNSDRREYLRGVCLEAACDEVRMVATQGHVMGIFRSDTVAPQGIEPGVVKHIIVPIETVMKLKPITSKRERAGRQWVSFSGAVESTQWVMQDGDDAHIFTPVDGAYPQYGKPVPESADGIAAQLDPDLLVLFADAAREFGGAGKDVRVKHASKDSGKPGLVKLECAQHNAVDNFFGLIMPIKSEASFTAPPPWVKQMYADRELALFLNLNKEAT